MAERSLSLQDHFLNSLRRSKSSVTIFLVKGVKLQGIVTWFDNFSILLRRDGQSQLVYKHAISTIMPGDMPADFAATHKGGHAGQGGRAHPETAHLLATPPASEALRPRRFPALMRGEARADTGDLLWR